jgi:hypothetical protein
MTRRSFEGFLDACTGTMSKRLQPAMFGSRTIGIPLMRPRRKIRYSQLRLGAPGRDYAPMR